MRKLVLIAILFSFTVSYAQEVKATVSSKNISSSDVFTFKIEAINANKNPQVDLAPLLNDFSMISGPSQQTNMQWINGKSSSSRSLSWSLVAKRDGKLTIPQLNVAVGKKIYQTQPIVMTVSESQKNSVSNELFLEINIDKKQAYVGEQITVTYKLYTRVNMSIQNVDFPKHSGFWVEELYVPQQVDFKDTVIEGVNYQVATIYRIALFPTKSGKLELTPMTLNCNVAVKSNNNFFNDPFFGSFGNQTVPKVIRTKRTSINVKEFPGEIPDGFSGSVGDFKISASLTSQKVQANNAVTFKIQFKGTGNINVISLPEIQFPQNLEVFPPTVNTEKEPFRDQISGTITKEYILIPRKTGRYTIPEIEISYFNPKVREWRKTTTQSFELLVEPDDNLANGVSGYTKKEVELLGEDIRYIRANRIKWNSNRNPYLLFGIYALSLVLLVLPSLLFKYKENRLSSADLRKSQKALRRANKILRNKKEDTFTRASYAIYGYLKDKLQLSSDKLDSLKVNEVLKELITDNKLIMELIDLIKICDAGRFAPDADITRGTIIKRTRKVLKQLNANL